MDPSPPPDTDPLEITRGLLVEPEKDNNKMSLELDPLADTEPTPPTPQPKSRKKDNQPNASGKKAVKMVHCTVANCSYSARYRKDLVRHYRKHTGEKPYSCDKCSKTFSRYDKLLQHTRVHQGIRSFKCPHPLCDYKCFDSTGLRKHSRVHKAVKPFSCQMCSYRTKDPNQLKVHIRFHTGDAPYVCTEPNCQKGFKTHTDLKRHFRIHSGEKPYTCTECDYASNVKSNLVTHIKRKHSTETCVVTKGSEVLENPVPTEVITSDIIPLNLSANVVAIVPAKSTLPFDVACKLCPFKSNTIRAFKIHMRKKHQITDYDPYLPKLDETERIQNSHESCKTKGKINRNVSSVLAKAYQCDSCSASFVTESSLTCHSRQHKKPQLHPPPAPTVDSMMKYPSKKHLAVLHDRLETFGTIEQSSLVKLTQPPPVSPPMIPHSIQQARPIVIAYAGPSQSSNKPTT